MTMARCLLALSLVFATAIACAAPTRGAGYRDSSAEPAPPSPHVAKALELYKQGPSAAPQILAELDLALADDPKDFGALMLKAITLKGTDRCKDALVVLDTIDKVLAEEKRIDGGASFQRAQCLYYEKRYAEAKRLLHAYVAFMRKDTTDSKRRYDELLALVETGEAKQAGRPIPARVEFCGIYFKDRNLTLQMPLPAMDVAGLADGGSFRLPTDVPQQIIAVYCERESIVPLVNDYQVVAAGYALRIHVDDRRGELKLVEGKLRFDMLDGEMTPGEATQAAEYVGKSQSRVATKT